MSRARWDVIIVGGGVMGSAIAYYLMRFEPTLAVLVVERDPTYARASTTLSDGNTRVQFNLEANIRISLYALEVLATFADEMAVDGERPDIAFRQEGNLFLVDEANRAAAREGLARQQALGAAVEWLDPAALGERYPFLKLEGIAGATLGPLDGTMSPLAVLLAYRRKAISLGARYHEAEVAGLLVEGRRVVGVELASGERWRAPVVVNGAGAWARTLARSAGVELPVAPIMREVYVIRGALEVAGLLPLIVFPSGLYCHHETGDRFMVARSLADDPETERDFVWERRRFEERIWPELAEWVPAFDRLRLTGGWAGLYAVNTFDGNAILGEWPERPGLYLANGFSGHGFQQCHAVGRYLAELILDRPPALDLSIFAPDRLLAGEPVTENPGRIV